MGIIRQEVSCNQGAARKISLTERMIDCKQRRKKLHRIAFSGDSILLCALETQDKTSGNVRC